jgi:hypothetical protein
VNREPRTVAARRAPAPDPTGVVGDIVNGVETDTVDLVLVQG